MECGARTGVEGIINTSKKVANLTNQVFGSGYKKAVLNEL